MQDNYKDHQKTKGSDPRDVHPKTDVLPETKVVPEKHKEVPPVTHA